MTEPNHGGFMKNKLTKLLALTLALLMLVTTLAACDGSQTGNEQTTDTESTTTDAPEDSTPTDTSAQPSKYTVNGAELSNFVIVYATDDDNGATDADGDLKRNNDDKTSVKYANNLKTAILESTGIELAVKADTERESEYEILIGNVNRDIVRSFTDNAYANVAFYRVTVSGKKIALLSLNSIAQKLVYDEFVKAFFTGAKESVSITDADVIEGDIYGETEIAINKRINETDIRIASNNIFFHERSAAALYRNRKTTLLQSFVLFDADVLMLQECGYDKTMTAANKTWHDELDPILPTLGYTQVPITLDPDAKENYTPIWYRADKLDLVESKYLLYDTVKFKPDSYLSDSKSYTMAVFKVKGTENMFACFSTHFTWADDRTQISQNEPVSDALLKSDATEAVAGVTKLKEKYGADFPIILMGDLNCAAGSAPYNILDKVMNNAKFFVGVKKNNTDYGTTHNLGSLPQKNGGVIDHTFISGKGFKPVLYQHVINDWAANSTDHIPLLLDIAFN